MARSSTISVIPIPEGYEVCLRNPDGEVSRFTVDETAFNLLRLSLDRAFLLKNAEPVQIQIGEAV